MVAFLIFKEYNINEFILNLNYYLTIFMFESGENEISRKLAIINVMYETIKNDNMRLVDIIPVVIIDGILPQQKRQEILTIIKNSLDEIMHSIDQIYSQLYKNNITIDNNLDLEQNIILTKGIIEMKLQIIFRALHNHINELIITQKEKVINIYYTIFNNIVLTFKKMGNELTTTLEQVNANDEIRYKTIVGMFKKFTDPPSMN